MRDFLAVTASPAPGASARPPLPTFLIIGAQKSATRWLRSNLGKHPDVFAADEELAYFNRRSFARNDADWYRDQFVGWAGEPIVGEATPGYMMWTNDPARTARRINKTLPDVRLVALLRNPVDRAYSAMVHHKKRGRIPADARLLDIVRSQPTESEQFGLVTGGWYGASLQPYRKLFGDRLLVLLHDDVLSDPRSVYTRTLEHIGASTTFVPPELDTVVFSNRDSRSARSTQDLTPRDRVELYEYFRKDISLLERMFALDCSGWRPGEG
jgi:hypothetical protein